MSRALRPALSRTSCYAGVALVTVLATACSTSYQPRPSARVATVLHGGRPYFVRDGHEHAVGLAAGGLQDAVAGIPLATEHARAAHRDLAFGWSANLVGMGGMIAGLVVAGPVGLAIAGVGLVSAASGLGLVMKGQTHVLDAVNAHNDFVSAP